AVVCGALEPVDEACAREGDHAGFLVALVDVDEYRGVGAGAAVVAAAAEVLVASGAGVGAEDEDVLGAVVGLVGPVRAERLVDVDAADVAVELEVDVAEAGAAEHHDGRRAPRGHLHAGPLPARLAPLA